MAKSRPRADAEEVCQEVYFRAYRGMQRFRGEAELSTWLFRIAWNTALSHRNLSPLRRGAVPIDAILDRAAPDDTEKSAIDREWSRTLALAITVMANPVRS